MATPLLPTFQGYIGTTIDALILFEACLQGILTHVPRRPHDRERPDLIKSGFVFVYEEHASGIKRWTDGVSWSPSRILSNFLIYRELDKPFAPGEKKRALKKTKKPQVGVTKTEVTSRTNGNWVAGAGALDPNGSPKDPERALIGSLVDSYAFKPDGLMKKTISVKWNGVTHHLVSYYTVADATSGRLVTPSKDPQLNGVVPRQELVMNQNFRAPIQEAEIVDERYGLHPMFPMAADYDHGSGAFRSVQQPSVQYQGNYVAAPPHFAFQSHPLPPPGSLPPPSGLPPPGSIPPSTGLSQQEQHSYMTTLPPSTSMTYAHQSQENYSLDSRGTGAGAPSRYATGAPQDTPRRHPAYDAGQTGDLSGMSPATGGYYMPPQRQETDDNTQQFGLDNSTAWPFDPGYYPNGNSSWPGQQH